MKIRLSCSFLILILSTGCMVNQELVMRPDLSGALTVEGGIMPFAHGIMNDFAQMGGFDQTADFYDLALRELRAALSERPGVTEYQIDQPQVHHWRADVAFDDIEALLGEAENGGLVQLTREGGRHTLHLRFDRARAAELEKLAPFLDSPAFSPFNPAATEGYDGESYITGVLGFIFGEENISALRQARILLDVRSPEPVTALSGGWLISEKHVRFELPLTRFLVPEEPVDWSVSWAEAP